MKKLAHVIYDLILALADDAEIRAAIYDALAEWQRRLRDGQA